MTLNGIKSYKNTLASVDESDKGALLIKVFQMMLEKLDIVNIYIESKNFEKRYAELSKIRQVIEILYDSVDVQYGEISKNLQNLYLYIIKRLDEANIKNDKNVVEECKSLIKTLHEGFEEAYKKERENNSGKDSSSAYDTFVASKKQINTQESPGRTLTVGGYL